MHANPSSHEPSSQTQSSVPGTQPGPVLELLAPEVEEDVPSTEPVEELLSASSVVELEDESDVLPESVVTGDVLPSLVLLDPASVSPLPGSSDPPHPHGAAANKHTTPQDKDLMRPASHNRATASQQLARFCDTVEGARR